MAEIDWLLRVGLTRCVQTIVATAIPKITRDFEGLDKVGWYGAIFFATVGAFQSSCTFHFQVARRE